MECVAQRLSLGWQTSVASFVWEFLLLHSMSGECVVNNI